MRFTSITKSSDRPLRHPTEKTGLLRTKRKAGTLAGAIHLACGGLAFSAAALPMLWSTQASAQSQGSSQTRLAFDIPAGPLSQALNQFAEKAGLYLSGAGRLTQNKSSAGLQGEYTVTDGLQQLLQGSGVTYRFTGDNTIALLAAVDHEKVTTLPVIRISGEKIERRLEETLTSVAVVTSADIQDHNDIDLQNVTFRTPGVYSQSGNENWGIRGVPVSGFDSQGAGTMNGAVTVFVDGAAQPHRLVTLNPLNLWDMEQVEIFRGSQSTTQGRNSLAGAVVLKSNDPTYDSQFSFRANAGKYGERGASAIVNGALVDGMVAGRVSVDHQESDGYIRNETLGKNADAQRSLNARGKLLVQPTQDLDILLTLARTELRQGSYSVSAENGRPLYFSQFLNTAEEDEMDQDSAIVSINYRLSDAWALTSLTTGTWAEYRSLLDFDSGVDLERDAVRKHKQELVNQEFRLNYDTESLTGFVGVYYGTHTNDIDDRINLNLSGIDDPAMVASGDVEIRNAATFGEVDWEFVDQWRLNVGLRYDHEKNDTEFNYIDPLGLATVSSANVDTSFNEWLPKLGISHELSENHLVGLTWKRGYRGGGIDLSTSTAHAPYDPEYTNTWELSWRGT